MDATAHNLEIWHTCSILLDALKNVSKSLRSNVRHNIYGQSKFSPYISFWEAIKYSVLQLVLSDSKNFTITIVPH